MTNTRERDGLTIQITETDDQITADWSGKSVLRNPADFVAPILTDILRNAVERGKQIVLEFRNLSYMNSSTITPMIKMLEQARTGDIRIEVRYLKSRRWQEMSFSALRVFETADGRVRIVGIE